MQYRLFHNNEVSLKGFRDLRFYIIHESMITYSYATQLNQIKSLHDCDGYTAMIFGNCKVDNLRILWC